MFSIIIFLILYALSKIELLIYGKGSEYE